MNFTPLHLIFKKHAIISPRSPIIENWAKRIQFSYSQRGRGKRSSKGFSGRIIPLHKDVRNNLIELLDIDKRYYGFDINNSFIVRTERSPFTTSQTIVNMFQGWYKRLGLIGCSSHSGRRTFITETSKKISLVGGSLRDIQMMVGHSSLQTTQRYIESDSESQRKVVDLL